MQIFYVLDMTIVLCPLYHLIFEATYELIQYYHLEYEKITA